MSDYSRGIEEGKRRFHSGKPRPSKPERGHGTDYDHGVYEGWGKAKEMANDDAQSVAASFVRSDRKRGSWPKRVP